MIDDGDDEKIDDDDDEKIENLKVQFDCENKGFFPFIYIGTKRKQKSKGYGTLTTKD